MKKLGHSQYSSLFLNHLDGFLSSIISSELKMGKHLISVSGGVDSMTLLFCAWKLKKENKIGPIRALFIHHQTRPGQDLEMKLVENFCLEKGIAFSVKRIEGLTESFSNFEAKAREERKKITFEELRNGELLWQGHHLDDSFEWHMMQKSKTHQLKSTLGIPVKNKKILRPFLCVTKNQIKQLARFEKIPFLEDPTNLDTHFERNYFRINVIPPIKEKFPKHLKMYASQMNELSSLLKINLIKKTHSIHYKYPDGDIFLGKDFDPLELTHSIHRFSKSKRGEVHSSIKKMLSAIQNQKKGPFYFSGNVQAYYSLDSLLITSRDLKNADQLLAGILQNVSVEQFNKIIPMSRQELSLIYHRVLSEKSAPQLMPFLVLVLERPSVQKTLNTSVFDPMFPKVSEICQKNGFRFTSMKKCLATWEKKEQKLPPLLKICPLHTLSHLFSSQA
jgi:tRNA(Ile)-lysidine synthase